MVAPATQLFIVPDEVTELVRSRAKSEAWEKINQIDCALAELPQQSAPLNHVFTPGAYTRSVFLAAGMLLTTRIHLTEHPFVLSAGVVAVWDDEAGWEILQASHIGITKAGTRRILYVLRDCIWTTFHLNPTNETDPDKMVDLLTCSPAELGHMGHFSAGKLAEIEANAKPSRLSLP